MVRALLVDDFQPDINLCRFVIRDLVDVVGEAQDGVEGLRQFEVHRPDLVITDVHMPHGGGLEMARRILEIAPGTDFIFLTDMPDLYAREVEDQDIGPVIEKERMLEVLPGLLQTG